MHPLQHKLDRLRRRLRRLVTLRAACLVLAVVLGAAVLLGCTDYLLRLHDRGLRLISSLVAVGLALWAGWRYLLPLVTARYRVIDLARRVERHYPSLRNRLASSIDFLRQADDEPLAGSAAMRRMAVAQATAEAEPLDFAAVLDARPVWRAAAATASVLALAGLLAAVNPAACRIALARLANPLGNTAWPRVTHLELPKAVHEMARGQAFEVQAVDAGGTALPADVWIHYRTVTPDGTVAQETNRMRPLGQAVVARRENVTQPFSYRIEGGDDHTLPWIDVQVLEPPAIDTLDVQLTPPDYTGWPAYAGQKQIRALAGTRAQLSGVSLTPLASITLCLSDGRRLPGHVSDDGLRFQAPAAAPLVVDKSQSYWFELVGREGGLRQESPRWEIVAVPDAPPTVSVEQPVQHLFATPTAAVPLEIAAQDDVGLRSIGLEWTRSDHATDPPAGQTVYHGPPQPAPLTAGQTPASTPGESRTVAYRWELGPLALRPGVELGLSAVAADYRGVTGHSDARRISLITPEELQDRLAARQAAVLAELGRALRLQREHRDQVAALAIPPLSLGGRGAGGEGEKSAAAANHFNAQSLDRLQAAELGQRQVTQILTGHDEGIPGQVAAILADLANNHVDSPDVQRHLEGLLAALKQLAQEELSPLAQALTAAIKAAQVPLSTTTSWYPERAGVRGSTSDHAPDAPEDPEQKLVATSLDEALRRQQRVIATLERLLGQLGQWGDYRRFHQQMSQLLRDQEDLSRRTAELARTTLTKDVKDLLPREAADAAGLAAAQLELSLRLDQLQEQMRRTAPRLRTADPLAADTLAEAVDEIARLATGGLMRATRGSIERNQMGQATQAQRQIQQDLRDVLEILAGRRQRELAHLEKKLQAAQQELGSVASRQGELAQRMDQAAAQKPDHQRQSLPQLTASQAKLADEAQELARQLEQLLAEEAGKSTQAAAEKMRQAAESAAQHDAAAAGQHAQEARRQLENAVQALAEQIRQAQAEQAGAQQARLSATVKDLQQRQQQLSAATHRVDAARRSAQPTPPEIAEIAGLHRQQHALHEETQRLQDEHTQKLAVNLALGAAADEMAQAAAGLERRQTGPATQTAQEEAGRRLELLAAALESSAGDKPSAPRPGEKRQGGAAGQCGAGASDLKILKALQEDVNRRTQQLAQQTARQADDPELRRRAERLGHEQDRLAEIMEQFAAQAAQAARQAEQLRQQSDQRPADDVHPAPPPQSSADDELERSLFQPGAAAPAAKQPPKENAPAKPGPIRPEDLNRQLMRELGVDATPEQQQPLGQLAQDMRDSGGRVARGDCGRQTQALQERIVVRLDQLLQQCQAAPSGTAGKTASSKPGSKPGGKPSGAKSPAGKQFGSRPSQNPAALTSSGNQPGGGAGPPGDLRTVLSGLWGELPEHLRNQMLQRPDEAFLPKYEALIEDYYRQLSGQQGRGGEKP